MPPELIAWLIGGFLVLIALHELTHVAIARWYGHPCVCVAVNPIGVAVVFEDKPTVRYWIVQVVLPAVVTWLVCYVWLYVALTYPSNLSPRVAAYNLLEVLPGLVTLITVLTSGGDLLGAIGELRNPLHIDDRIQRDFQLLRKIPNLVLFTAHGRQRWQGIWHGAEAKASAASAA